MHNETYYIKAYDTYVHENCQHDKGEASNSSGYEIVVGDFEELLAASTDAYLDAYENNHLDHLKELLNNQRRLRRLLTAKLRDYPDQVAIVSSKFVQTYNIFNKILQLNMDRHNLESQMAIIIKSYSRAEDILSYLYRHAHVRHKTLLEELKIPRSTLTDTLQILERYDCVERIGEGRGALYNLTNEGRKYVRNNLNGIDNEIIIDYDSFQKDSYQIAQNKALYTHSPMEAEISFKVYRRTSQALHSDKKYDDPIPAKYVR